MKHAITCSAMLVAAMFAVVPLGHAATWDMSGESATVVSGYEGDSSVSIDIPQDFGATSISWYEKANNPCEFSVYGFNLKPEAGRESRGANNSFCTGASRQSKMVRVSGSDTVIRGVAVCTTGQKNQRLKGIKVYSARVSEQARRVESTTQTRFAKHVNCKYWNGPAYCPSGQIATRLVIYRRGGSAVGLGLGCRKLVWD